MRSVSSIDDAWVAGDDNGVGEVLARTDGAGAERVSVAAPAKAAQQAALEMAAKRAKVVYFAGLPEARPGQSARHERAALQGARRSSAPTARRTASTASRWTTSTAVSEDLARVVTHRFPLEQIAEAFETIRSGAGLKMVILP